jgi:hypothetical protein
VLADEPVGGRRVGGGQGCCAGVSDDSCVAVVDIGGGVHPDSGMAMIVVIPPVERGTERARVLHRAKRVGEVGPVLQGLVRYAGDRLPRSWVIPAMTLCDWRARDFRALSCSRADRD